ncbi:hypothetical protein O3P69_016819 [Scylla paramamosain]|uniref:Uncharacterized protein n=1 Tax=Scylla paramamosain TaxID=85552 RepID=A0AAW0SZW5_SCYPA
MSGKKKNIYIVSGDLSLPIIPGHLPIAHLPPLTHEGQRNAPWSTVQVTFILAVGWSGRFTQTWQGG